MIKDTMKRKKPSFNEAYHGYRTFSELLEDAQKEGLLELDTDKRSRTYVVTRFGSELKKSASPAVKKRPSRRRRSSGKRHAALPASNPQPATETSNGVAQAEVQSGAMAESPQIDEPERPRELTPDASP
jgi:hypothetical protein